MPPPTASSAPGAAASVEGGPGTLVPSQPVAAVMGWRRGSSVPAPKPTISERVKPSAAGDAFVIAAPASAGAESLAALSLSQLARRRTLEALDEVVGSRGAVGPEAMPHEPAVKAFRKSLLKLRDQLDMYPHVYVRGLKDADAEPWLQLRRAVDDGYDLVGDFKDLFDTQGLELATVDPVTGVRSEGVSPGDVDYKPKELERRREAIRAWAESFFAAKHLEASRQLLSSPSQTLQNPRRRDLSELFWGGVSVGPKPGLSGLENVARLCEAQLKSARHELHELKDVKDLVEEGATEHFHEVRKRMRAAANVLAQSPEIVGEHEARATELRTKVQRFVAEYGEIEDLIVRREGLTDSGKKKDLAKRIDGRWDELRKHQEKENLAAALKELEDLVK